MSGEAFQSDFRLRSAIVAESAKYRARRTASPPQIAARTFAGSCLDLRQQLPRLLEAGNETNAPGKGQFDLELGAHQLLRELLLPTEQGEQVALHHQGHGAVFDVLERQRIVFGGNCVLNSLAPKFARRYTSDRRGGRFPEPGRASWRAADPRETHAADDDSDTSLLCSSSGTSRN